MTNPNIPHMTFINTIDGYAWLTLYLETYISKLAWQMPVAATIANKFKENALKAALETDKNNVFLANFLNHDFHARGGNPFTSIAVGLGHALSNLGSDTLNVIPAARYYYDFDEDDTCIFSVNASEHSVSTTKIFTVGEQQMLADWMKDFPNGILSVVSDTFDLWKLITEYLPNLKEEILARNGKLVIRPDSGDPVDIICGINSKISSEYNGTRKENSTPEQKGVIELLWDIFGGTINEQGYKVLDSHIGAIYGDSISLERQEAIYERLKAKGFATTNVVLGVGSYTYVMVTRDTAGFAAKGSWFEIDESGVKTTYNIYKDPVTDDGMKISLRGFIKVDYDYKGEIVVQTECNAEEESQGLLQLIYKDGEFFNQTTLEEIRNIINNNLSK
jgi:nicotinamide phosphoribosyltransferase